MNVKIENNKELLKKLENFLIEYKPLLNLDKQIKFGVELEYASALQEEVSDKINNLYETNKLKEHFNNSLWINKGDPTVDKKFNNRIYGGEVTTPILRDEKKTWQELELICNTLKNLGAIINETTSSHIHIDTNILENNPKYLLNLIKLWTIYEEIIYRFYYGEYLSDRGNINIQYKSLKLKLLKLLKLKNLSIEDLKEERTNGLSFNHIDDYHTLEFRVPNGTLNPIIIQNNILFTIRLLEASKNISEVFLNQKISKLSITLLNNYGSGKSYFDKIYISEAIELANIIFTNEYERLCFLKQYFKDFETSKEFIKAKRITREKRR